MKRIIILIFLLGTVPLFSQQKRLALVIGNSAYQNGMDLKNPVNDAQLMRNTLQNLGFEVLYGTDCTLREMDSKILNFWRMLAEYDVTLFYYAGHGIQVDGVNYLLPVDAELDDAYALDVEAVNVGDVVEKFQRFPNNINIVILDACRDNPYRSWMRGGNNGFAQMDAPAGTLIAFATSPGATAADGSGDNGPYTKHLTAQMVLEQRIEDVFIFTRNAVREETGGRQIPQEWSQLTGQFYFRGSAESGRRPSPEVVELEKYGDLVLTCDIFGELFIDGERFTTINSIRQLRISPMAVGPHLVEIRGAENWSQEIYIFERETKKIATSSPQEYQAALEQQTSMEQQAAAPGPAGDGGQVTPPEQEQQALDEPVNEAGLGPGTGGIHEVLPPYNIREITRNRLSLDPEADEIFWLMTCSRVVPGKGGRVNRKTAFENISREFDRTAPFMIVTEFHLAKEEFSQVRGIEIQLRNEHGIILYQEVYENNPYYSDIFIQAPVDPSRLAPGIYTVHAMLYRQRGEEVSPGYRHIMEKIRLR